jgi:hypothetical protein
MAVVLLAILIAPLALMLVIAARGLLLARPSARLEPRNPLPLKAPRSVRF